jgi:PKD repeat protein
MKMKQKMGIVLISIILLSATALAATPTPVAKPVPVQKLKAAFTVTYNSKIPMMVKFTDKSMGKPTMWAWNFGDKTKIVTTKNAMHTYKKAGTYTVTLMVMKGKEMSKATKRITVPMKKIVVPVKM